MARLHLPRVRLGGALAGDVAEDRPRRDGLAVHEAAVGLAGDEHAAAVLRDEQQLEVAPLARPLARRVAAGVRRDAAEARLASLACLRGEDVEEGEAGGDVRVVVAHDALPRVVHEEQPPVHRGALDQVVRVLEEVAEVALSLLELRRLVGRGLARVTGHAGMKEGPALGCQTLTDDPAWAAAPRP